MAASAPTGQASPRRSRSGKSRSLDQGRVCALFRCLLLLKVALQLAFQLGNQTIDALA